MASREKTLELADAADDKPHHYGYKKDFHTALPQLLAVSVKNLLLLGYGMTLGYTTILIPAVKDPIEGEILQLEKSELSWISSINYIVVPLGCAVSGAVTTPLGRRRAMQLVNIPFAAAWLLYHYASTTAHLYAALVLTGLAGGLLEAPVLTYVAEITQPHLRGALSATSSLSIIFGVFTQFLFGLFLSWRDVALVNIIFTVLAVIALCFVPESPHWLVSKKRLEDARKSLQWLRGWTGPLAVEEELHDIEALFKIKNVEVEDHETVMEKLSLYTERSFLVPYFLVCYAFFVGHFSGMTTLQTFAVSIFQMLDAPIDKYYATLILGLIQIFGTSICVVLVHYSGKRALTFFSTFGAGVCCFLVAAYDAYIKFHGLPGMETAAGNVTQDLSNSTLSGSSSNMHGLPGVEMIVNNVTENLMNSTLSDGSSNMVNRYSWIPMVLLMLLAFITHTGIRLLPWILIGEVFSAKTRSSAAGLSSSVAYIFGFLANKMYISMVDLISIWGTYGFYGFICFSGCLVFYYILPETEGKKLNDIENHFAGVRRLSNDVYRSKVKVTRGTISKMEELRGASNPAFDADRVCKKQ